MLNVYNRPQRYQLSFTFGALLIPETRLIAEAYRKSGDWNTVRSAVIEENILAKTRSRTARRYYNEIKIRLESAYSWERSIIANVDRDRSVSEGDVATVLFALFTRCYRVVGDFLAEVIRPRFQEGLPTLDAAMFRAFMDERSQAHSELTRVTEATRAKLTEIAFKAMREAGIISGRRGPYTITPPSLSPGLRNRYCAEGDPRNLMHLLWTDEEIKPCLK